MSLIERFLLSQLSASERAAELTSLLANALIRTSLDTSQTQRAVDLGFCPPQRLHSTPFPPGVSS